MSEPTPQQHLILSHAPDDAYVATARTVLANMGYTIVTREERGDLPGDLAGRHPDLLIADEPRLAECIAEGDDRTPVIVVAGRNGVQSDDPRILGAVSRPAGLHELYRLIQQALESCPRSAPRSPTHLMARCRMDEREWRASVLSLSENGCLLRSPEPIALGAQLELCFELPEVGLVETAAEASYQLLPDLGLVFHGTPASSREAIAAFVERNLANTL